MAQNLIDLLERLLGSNEVLSRIGALIGLNPEKAKAAIGAAAFAIRIAAPVILALGLSAAPAGAQSLVEYVRQSCNTELTTYCSQVTPGENRLLACIYAHGDKLSGQCEKALYDAAAALERAINAIAYVANQCRTDIETKCAQIQPGQGRIAQCLASNKSSLSPPCTQAMTEVGAM